MNTKKNSKRNKYRKYIGQKNNSPSHPKEQILYSTVINQRWKKKCNPKKVLYIGTVMSMNCLINVLKLVSFFSKTSLTNVET